MKHLRSCVKPTKFNILSASFIVSFIILCMLSLTSLGMAGSTFMVWQELQTTSMLQYYKENFPWFFRGMQFLIAMDVILIVMSVIVIFSVFKFHTKGNLIIQGVWVVIAIIRWISGLIFLLNSSELREKLNQYLIDIEQQGVCSDDCLKDPTYNFINCQKYRMWGSLYSYEISFMVMLILLGIALTLLGKIVNKMDVIIQQSRSFDPAQKQEF